MRISDESGNTIELYTASDGSVRFRTDNPASGATSIATQVLSTASDIYRDEGVEFERFHQQTIRDIKTRYGNSVFGRWRTAWAIRRYEQEVLYPFHRRLQEEQTNRIMDAGHFSYTIAKQAAQLQADHILKKVDLINQMELAPLQRELQFFHAETELAIKAKFQELEDERLDKELDRLLKIKEAEFQHSAAMERIRQQGAERLARIQANSEFRIQELKSSTDIKIRKIETIAERKKRLNDERREDKRLDREDLRQDKVIQQQIINKAWSQGAMIPQWQSQIDSLKATTSEEKMAAIISTYNAFLTGFQSLSSDLSFEAQLVQAEKVSNLAAQLTQSIAAEMFKQK